MRNLLIAVGVSVLGLVPAHAHAADVQPAAASGPLTVNECVRVIRRSLFNMTLKPGDSMYDSLMASCVAGRNHYTRNYFNCIFASTYSDSLDCAYKERGIDRSIKEPMLAHLETGDVGGYDGQARMGPPAGYKDGDPHTAFDSFTRERYFKERDNILRSLDRPPPANGNVAIRASHHEIKANGKSYWVVREEYPDLQLVKIVREDEKGTDTITCGRLGSSPRVEINKGMCAAMLQHYLQVALAE